MANYSKEEIKSFEEKDLRISKLSLLRDVISKVNDLDELKERLDEVKDVVSNLVKFTYNGSACVSTQAAKSIDWIDIAANCGLILPDETNIKILDLIYSEYKTKTKENIRPQEILCHILDRFGRYPKEKESILTVIESLIKNER